MGTNQLSVDLARFVAMSSVVLLHSTAMPSPTTMDLSYVYKWWTWDIWSSVAWIGVPIFIMISGALLLQPSKVHEPLKEFFKKRWKRIGLPFIFWGSLYVAWNIFVNHSAVNTQFVLNTVLSGPYFQFWYLYMLIGLYIATPVLRVLVAYMERKVFTYLMAIWFVGTILQPFISLLQVWNVNYFFYFSGYIGCYLFGAYLREAKVHPKIPYVLLSTGLLWSIFGNYLVSGTFGYRYNYFIWGNLTPNTIFTAAALFLILTRVNYTNKVLSLISRNTLSIYLFHVMILESFQRGYFGVIISAAYLNLAVEIPLMAITTLAVTLLVITPAKKTPILNRFI